MNTRGNPHGYEQNWTIENHRDELIDRLGEAISELKQSWILLGRAIPLVHILNENEQAKDWLKDVKRYINHDAS